MIKVQNREDFLKELSKILPSKCSAVEVGVLYGDFSKQILEVLEPETLILIDPYSVSDSKYDEALHSLATAYSTESDYVNLLNRFDDNIKSEQVLVNREYSYHAVKNIPNNSLDLVYLDGSHVYFDVKRDLVDWIPKLKLDGVMSGHDHIEHQSFGVIQAVKEFCEEHGFKMLLFNTNGGDWALKRI